MRLSAFQARRVGRWARQSSRLWICISSTWSVLSSDSDRVICSMPLSRPDVHTLVAMKALLRVPIRRGAASRSPITPSAAPYIGEVSITEPPASNSTASTSASGARSSGRRPTSKVRQVPQPTMGSISPEEGILRWCMRAPVCAP